MTRVFFVLGFLLFLAAPAFAALPPLDHAERQAESNVIVRGEIVSVDSRKKKIKWGYSDLEMTLGIKIAECTKGGLEPGTVIYVECWTAEDRPNGWAGDGGQRPRPDKGDRGTFYAEDRGGKLHLLHPNGWDSE
jgi:hypothetical protein